MDNLVNLRGIAELFDSHNSDKFISRLASMFMTQEPACIVVRGIPVTGDPRPDDLGMEINPGHKKQAGQKYSEEVFKLLNEQIGGNRIQSEMGNVIRSVDPTNPAYIKVEPTHTHPDDRINNMFCNISDGAISNVTFVDDVWKNATEEERALFQKHKFIDFDGSQVLWNEDFVRCDDIFERLENASPFENNESLSNTAVILAEGIRANAREYHLIEGDMVFFAQMKTLRGAPAYKTPESGIEKRWYQSMTFGERRGVFVYNL